MLQKIADTLHIGYGHLIWVALSYTGIHVLLGLLTGWLAFALPRRVESEMLQAGKKTGMPE
jgi:Na+/H+ antiporter NhaB